MAAALPFASAAVGLWQNEKARGAANDARRAAMSEAERARMQQQPLIDRQVALYDTMRNIVENAKARGQFNSDWMIQQLNNDHQKSQTQTVRGLTSGLSTMGYRPGDSEIGVRLDSALAKGQADRDKLATDLRRSSFFDELNAYSAIPSQSLGNASAMMNQSADRMIGINSSLANFYQSQIQNPASFIAAIMPYLQKKESSNTNKDISSDDSYSGAYYSQGYKGGSA